MNIEGCIKINEQVFIDLYEAHWKELYLYSNSYVNDTEVAKELVQEVFISLWENRHKTTIKTSEKKYLFSAVKLKIFEHYRKQAVRERYLWNKSFETPENPQNTEQQVTYHELKNALHNIVGNLPEKSRMVYQMSREEGMSNKSIATHLSISQKAVEANITRALSTIKKKLKTFF